MSKMYREFPEAVAVALKNEYYNRLVPGTKWRFNAATMAALRLFYAVTTAEIRAEVARCKKLAGA